MSHWMVAFQDPAVKLYVLNDLVRQLYRDIKMIRLVNHRSQYTTLFGMPKSFMKISQTMKKTRKITSIQMSMTKKVCSVSGF